MPTTPERFLKFEATPKAELETYLILIRTAMNSTYQQIHEDRLDAFAIWSIQTRRLAATPKFAVGTIAKLILLCSALSSTFSSPLFADEPTERQVEADVEFFESRIRPVLVKHCYECHSADSKVIRGGLQVDSRDAMRSGGDSGPLFEPGNPQDSLLIASLKHESFEMPPDAQLPDAVIADFVKWIERGAIDPRTKVRRGKLKPVDWDAAAEHWAFKRITEPVPPEYREGDRERVKNPIDQFVLRKLRDSGFTPAARADKRTLIRRATFDLIGLPPTVAEVEDFLNDESPDAFAHVVERLLNSPHYGERWGRHWLDLVRYANTNGADENHSLPNAWRYRDWVVKKLNADLPLDEFIVQQLAGDLLPVPDDEAAAGELLKATGMLVIGPKMLAEQDKDKMIIDIVDEQIDSVSRTMLGLTVGCARCHDHKFDPISANDYYALAGIFYSTRTMAHKGHVSKWLERPLPSRDIRAQRMPFQTRFDKERAKLYKLRDAKGRDDESFDAKELKRQQELVDELEKEMPPYQMVMAVEDGTPTDLAVHIRGSYRTLSPDVVPRAMPKILTNIHTAPTISTATSGRLELAQWIASPENPLTARVMVNRIWMWHFGEALVRTPSNFGLQADAPTHPQLLDWLAQQLIRDGWSLKNMHRLIMASATYQMSSRAVAEDEERDPENRLWRRQNRRRLEAEPIRDSILLIGGELDLTTGGKAADTDSNRRAIYLQINRSRLYEMFSMFDYVEPATHIPQRPTTVTPQQSLFMMNDPMVIQQAENLARQLLKECSADSAVDNRQLVRMAFSRLYSRLPVESELDRIQKFLEVADSAQLPNSEPHERQLHAWSALCRTLMATNEFIYVE